MQNGPYGHSFGMNVAAGPSPMTMYNQPSVRPSQPFVNNASGWHAPKVASSSDFQHISAVDAYRQQHEVTAMVGVTADWLFCGFSSYIVTKCDLIKLLLAPRSSFDILILAIDLLCSVFENQLLRVTMFQPLS